MCCILYCDCANYCTCYTSPDNPHKPVTMVPLFQAVGRTGQLWGTSLNQLLTQTRLQSLLCRGWLNWKIFCSSHLLGCYCHPDCLCLLVRFKLEFLMLKNVNKLSVEACLHSLASKCPLTQGGMHYESNQQSNQVAYVIRMEIVSQCVFC